jgi:hypothetical protein
MNAILIADVSRMFINTYTMPSEVVDSLKELASSGKLSQKKTDKPLPKSGPSSPGNIISLMHNKIHCIKQELPTMCSSKNYNKQQPRHLSVSETD